MISTVVWYSKCMVEESAPKRRGRPATGITPKRNVRIGATWDQAEACAKDHGFATMTRFVEAALIEKMARMERQDRRAAD